MSVEKPATDTTSDRPIACIAADSFGVASEAWLYRQVTGIRKLETRVLTWERLNADNYPADGIPIGVAPRSTNVGFLRRQLRSCKNFALGNGFFDGGQAESRWIRTHLSEVKPAVILAHYSVLALRLLPLCRAAGIPLVVHFHGFDISMKIQNPRFARKLIKNLNNFAACVCVASYQRDWLLENGAKRVHLIPCGAPMTEIPLANSVGAAPCRFIMVGRLVDKKRPDLSIRAFAKCVEHCPNAELTIIGGGPMEAECKEIAKSLGVTNQIHWQGVRPNEEVRLALSESSVFLQHSVTSANGNKEGWPVSVAEAAGAGLPIVSTRHAGILDQVDEGASGYLVDEGDWESMADHMIELATSPDRCEQMGKAAREKILQYDVANQIAILEDVLLSSASQTP